MKKATVQRPPQMRFLPCCALKMRQNKTGAFQNKRKNKKKAWNLAILGFFLVRRKGLEPLTY